MDIRGRQIAGPSPAGSSEAAQGGRDTEGSKQGGQGRRGWWSHERPSGGNRKNPRSPTCSRVVPESSAWSQDPSPPVPGSPCLAQEVWDRLADGQKVLSLSSQQALGLRGSTRWRGPHATSTWSTETPCSPPTRAVPQICQDLPWHPCSLSRRISGGPGWQEERGMRAEAFMLSGGKQLSAGVPVPTSPGTPWSRGGHLSAKPLWARSEALPPGSSCSPPGRPQRSLKDHTLPRTPCKANGQGAKGSAKSRRGVKAGHCAQVLEGSVTCAFYRENHGPSLPPLSATHIPCTKKCQKHRALPLGLQGPDIRSGVPQHTFL